MLITPVLGIQVHGFIHFTYICMEPGHVEMQSIRIVEVQICIRSRIFQNHTVASFSTTKSITVILKDRVPFFPVKHSPAILGNI